MNNIDIIGTYYIIRGLVGKSEVYSLVVASNIEDSIRTIKEIYSDIELDLILSLDDLFTFSEFINNSSSKMFELKMNRESVGIEDIVPVDIKKHYLDDSSNNTSFYVTKEEYLILLSSALQNFSDKNPELFISKDIFDKTNMG